MHGSSGWLRVPVTKPYLIKNILQLELRKRTALDVLDSVQLLSHALAVFPSNRRHLLLHQLFPDAGIISQIDLSADNEAGNSRTVVVDLGEPFLANVFKRGRGRNTEANEENVRLGI